MKLDIQLELKDAPGQLGSALAIVARYGGNILSVQHLRASQKGEWVPVRLQLEIGEEAVEPLTHALREESRVISVLGDVRSIPYAFLLLGHVFQSQVNDITDAVFESGAEVRTVRAEIASREKPSAVLVEIAAPSHDVVVAARLRVSQLAKDKGLAFVGALEEVGA